MEKLKITSRVRNTYVKTTLAGGLQSIFYFIWMLNCGDIDGETLVCNDYAIVAK